MYATGYIKSVNETEKYVEVLVPLDGIYIIDKQDITACEVKFDDGRTISADQRKKIFAMIRDISLWSGHDPEYLRGLLTWDFRSIAGMDDFSLSSVDMTTAKEFINYIIKFIFTHNIPTRKPLIEHSDDLGKYLYMCIEHRKCAICNDKADIHHVDKVGMGNDRTKINHIGKRAIALCRKHHNMAHLDEKELFEKYHVFGIKLDEYLVNKLKL